MDINQLKKIWELETKTEKYIASIDKNDCKWREDDFNLTVFPEPWWGNINDPKIIVLALNPSYVRSADELDTLVFKEFFDKNIKIENNQAVNLFDDEITSNNIQFINSSVSEWWRKVFEYDDKFVPNFKDDDNLLDIIKNKVGIFNLIGYHSKNADCLKKSRNNPKTTDIIIKYLNEIIDNTDNTNILFIFLWGKNTWESYGLKTTDINYCIEINKNDSKDRGQNVNGEPKKVSSQNKYFKNKISYDDFKKILKGIDCVSKIKETIDQYKTS